MDSLLSEPVTRRGKAVRFSRELKETAMRLVADVKYCKR